MLIAIVLDRPLAEAKALVEPPMPSSKPSLESCQDKQNHPVIAQMINPEADDDPTPLERAASSSGGHSHRGLSRIQHRQQRYSAPHHRCYWSTWVLVGWYTGDPATVKVPLSQPCFDHFFGPCFRGHDEAGLLAFSMSLFSDVGPLEAIAENKTEQKSAAKRRQRLLKAPLKPPSYDACFPTARSV